jgi:hypothetical protein
MDPTIPISAAATAIAVSNTGAILAQGAVQVVGGLFKRLVDPSADQIGQILGDYLRGFRMANLEKIEAKAKAKIEAIEGKTGKPAKVPPSVGIEILEAGSKASDEGIQDMWAGLLAASCTEDGKDDSNLQFIHIIATFSPQEARLFKWLYENCPMVKDREGIVQGAHFKPIQPELMEATNINSAHVLYGAISGLSVRGLLHDVAPFFGPTKCLGLSPLGTILSLRVQGIRLDPSVYFQGLNSVDFDGSHEPSPRWG